ncbi:hypothetical protein MBLNU459_g5682t2 [Dothideomycetes sp. NU459]
MAYFLPSSIQKRLLRYALSHTGLLDTDAIDLEKLDITLGRTNKIELRDVGLRSQKISALLQLPPNIRIETARVLLLRLTVPADIYHHGIVAEVDGVDLCISLSELEAQKVDKRQPDSLKSPQHRKTSRRIRPTAPYASSTTSQSHARGLQVPTTQDLARSFLQEEPLEEKRQLEALYISQSRRADDESVISDVSDESAGTTGTGTGLGLPGFLAGFLQGILDRFQIRLRNVNFRLDAQLPSSDRTSDGSAEPSSVTLRASTTHIDIESSGSSLASPADPHVGQRRVSVKGLSLDMICEPSRSPEPPPPVASVSSNLPRSPSPNLVGPDLDAVQALPTPEGLTGSEHVTTSPEPAKPSPELTQAASPQYLTSPSASAASIASYSEERYADADEGDDERLAESTNSFDIRPGEDNVSWSSRRSQGSSDRDHIWASVLGDQDLSISTAALRDLSVSGDMDLESHELFQHTFSSTTHRSMNDSQTSSILSNDRHPGSHHDDDPNSGIDSTADSVPATGPEHSHTPGELSNLPQTSLDEADLTQSTIYSLEEAESMYMSAISQGTTDLPDLRMLPGQWSSEYHTADDAELAVSSQPDQATQSASYASDEDEEDRAPTPRLFGTMDQSLENRPSQLSTSALTPNDKQRIPSIEASSDNGSDVCKRLLHVDLITLWLPATGDSKTTSKTESQTIRHGLAHHDLSTAESQSGPQMPGAFSMYGAFSQYAEEGASKRLQASQLQESHDSYDASPKPPAHFDGRELQVEIATIDVRADASVVRLLHRLQSVIVVRRSDPEDTNDLPEEDTNDNSNSLNLCLTVDLISLSFFESILEMPLRWSSHTDDYKSSQSIVPLLQLAAKTLRLSLDPLSPDSDIHFDIGKLTFVVGGTEVLSFREVAPTQSGRTDHSDISLEILRSKTTIKKKCITEVNVRTRPIAINVSLALLDETFGAFGGLSGIMERSGSLLSSGTSLNKDSPVSPQRRGVRFEGDAELSSDSSELKVNARVGGLTATLNSKACTLELRLSTTRVVSRANYLVTSIGHAILSGPLLVGRTDASAVSASVENIRLEYLFSPEESDLDRLLSLLTPSKDKYENDDDILLDTLLRQRRKGAVFRIKVGHISSDVIDWSFVDSLRSLGEELTKLSAVAKYLPEDDRPGLLILPRIKNFSLSLPLNDQFGRLEVLCGDLQAAHVAIPALFAFSLGTILVRGTNGDALLHELVSTASPDNLPMIMARMIGDEVEPTLKMKLFNLCIEYSVPTLLGLTGMDQPINTEGLVRDLAESIMDVAQEVGEPTVTSATDQSQASDRSGKKIGIDVLLHDCAIGLQPHESSSKGMFVFTNTKLSTTVPPGETFAITLELRKASLHIVDRIADPTQAHSIAHPRTNTTMLSDRLHSFISTRGFVPVSSIMSAKISLRVAESKGEEERLIDVELRDELFLLETCADSQQTLIAILNGLSPPTPPSQEPKFRSEPMTMEDMMASFSGDAFVRPGTPPSAIFDAEEQSLSEERDDLLAESSLTSSLYGPVDAAFDPEDTNDFFDGGDFERDTVESLLEEDPFEMTDVHATQHLSDDGLYRSLRKQCLLGERKAPIQLKPFYVPDDQLDKMQVQSTVLGAPHRFNTPAVAFSFPGAEHQGKQFPLQVRVRDVHVIWNLYDGYDWEETRDAISNAVEQVEHKLEERKKNRRRSADPEEEEESVIGDFLFNSIYIGVPATRDANDLRRQINRNIDDLASETESYATSGTSRPTRNSGGLTVRPRPRSKRLKLERSKAHKLCFELKGVSVDFLLHPPGGGEIQNSVDVRVRDFEIFDNVPTSTWRKFLTYHNDEDNVREMMKPMIHLELLNVRPVLDLPATEIAIRVSVMPLRLHVDQDALEFMTRFFEFKDDAAKTTEKITEPPFIQRIEINTVDLCLDYKPKKIDYGGLRSGHTSEFKNLVILDRANIKLKHAIVYGLRGFDTLHPTLSDIWTPDVIRNQLPGVLAGLAPLRPLVSLGAGVRDVVAIPVREYKKDGRIVRSIQKGAFHFAKTTTSELARLGAKIAVGTQTVLEGAENLLSPNSASPSGRLRQSHDQGWSGEDDELEERQQRAVSNYADQPLGVLQGLRSARRHLERDLLTARDAFIAVQGEALDSGSAAGAAQAVARHGPTIVLRPVIGASRAIGHTLMGIGNQVDKTNVRKVEDKYKRY